MKSFMKKSITVLASPLSYIHLDLEGVTSFKDHIVYTRICSFDYYSKEYQKGLELYSNGVLLCQVL